MIEALGEHNLLVMRSFNRKHWKSFSEGNQDRTVGGIMSSGVVGSQKSVFASHPSQNDEISAQSETLTILEQGAAAYDGHIPMGGEIEGSESNLSNLSRRKPR